MSIISPTPQGNAVMQFNVFAALKITVLKNALLQKNRGTVYRGCPAYQHKLAEASKKINENKFSAVAEKMKPHANTELTPSIEKIAVLVAEDLSKIRKVLLNTMFYSDIINIVSNSASRILNDKIDGQRIHDSIKSANTARDISIQSNNLPNSQNFSQNG